MDKNTTLDIKSVRVGGRDFKIKLLPSVEVGDGECVGQAFVHRGTVKICKELPADTQASTLLHEILEIINNDFELRLEHQQISTLEASLYGVLRNNPELLKELGR